MQLERLSEVLQFRQRAVKCRCTSRAKGGLNNHNLDWIKFPTHTLKSDAAISLSHATQCCSARATSIALTLYRIPIYDDDNDNAAVFRPCSFFAVLFCQPDRRVLGGGAHTRSELVRHNNYPPSECDCSCNCSTSCPCPCRVHVRIRQLRHLVITLLTYFLQQTQHNTPTTKWTVWMHLKYIYLLPPPLHKIALIVPVFFSQTDWAYQMNSEYRKLI